MFINFIYGLYLNVLYALLSCTLFERLLFNLSSILIVWCMGRHIRYFLICTTLHFITKPYFVLIKLYFYIYGIIFLFLALHILIYYIPNYVSQIFVLTALLGYHNTAYVHNLLTAIYTCRIPVDVGIHCSRHHYWIPCQRGSLVWYGCLLRYTFHFLWLDKVEILAPPTSPQPHLVQTEIHVHLGKFKVFSK